MLTASTSLSFLGKTINIAHRFVMSHLIRCVGFDTSFCLIRRSCKKEPSDVISMFN